MADKRADDGDSGRSWFRTDRLVQEGDKWFFLTREGTVEGPFETKLDASERLELYARVMNLKLISDGTQAELKKS